MLQSSNPDQVDIFKSLKYKTTNVIKYEEDIKFIIPSNDMHKVAFLVGQGKLVVADINEKAEIKNEITLMNDWAAPTGVCWSPDDQYLAYSKTNLDFNKEIYKIGRAHV